MNSKWIKKLRNKKIFSRLQIYLQSPFIVLPIVSYLAYGLLIPWLGLYADDQVFIWTFEILKENGIYRYFTYGGNRPVWGLFYSFFVPLLGHKPFVWHIFGIFWLSVCGLLIYQIIKLLFPEQKKFALLLSALFIVYPGMQLQFISLTFGHMWLIYSFYFASIIFSILSIIQKRNYLLFTILGIIASLINLLAFEYFIMLEFIRPIIIWFSLKDEYNYWPQQIRKTIQIWLPYFLLLSGIIIWRLFFFEFQTVRYQISIVDQFKTDFLGTIGGLIPIILKNIFWSTTLQAWGQPFLNVFTIGESLKFKLLYLIFSIILIFMIFIWLYLIKFEITINKKSKFFLLITGFLGLFFAGWPFWSTGLVVEPTYWNSRFTMPFMFGVVFLLAGLLSWIREIFFQRIIISLLLGLAISQQFLIANDFRRDWEIHNEIMWQLSWRLSDLEKGTTIFSNDFPIKYFSDNTLSAELNWVAAKNVQTEDPQYILGYLSEFNRLGLPYEKPEILYSKDMTSTVFHGTTDKVVAINYRYGSCLRVLDPRFDPINPLIKADSQKAAMISNDELIELGNPTFDLMNSNYGKNPLNNECYPFIKGQLMGQMGKWDEVVKIAGEIDFQSNIVRRDPMLSIVFMDGFLQNENFEQPMEISNKIFEINPEFSPVLCKYWSEIHHEAIQKVIENMLTEWECN